MAMEKSVESGKRKSSEEKRSGTLRKSGRWHIKLGDRLIKQGKYEQGMAEYHRALLLMLNKNK